MTLLQEVWCDYLTLSYNRGLLLLVFSLTHGLLPPVSHSTAMLPAASGSVTFSLLLLLVLGDWALFPKAAIGSPQKNQGTLSPSVGHHASWSLGLRVYRALRVGGDDPQKTNALFSPLMLAVSLDALGEASKGTTAGQIQELLKSPSQKGAAAGAAGFPQALKSMLEANNTAYSIRGASALFSKQASGLDQGFLKKAQSTCGLDHMALAAAGGKQSDSAALRTWALGACGGAKLAQLSTEPQAQSGALILANALRFKGKRNGNGGKAQLKNTAASCRESTSVSGWHSVVYSGNFLCVELTVSSKPDPD